MELPIIQDAATAASALVNILLCGFTFARLGCSLQAAPYTSSLSPVVGAVNIMRSTAEGFSMDGIH